MNSIKQAQPEHPINPLLSQRWSPYGFDKRPVAGGDIQALLEAARWAPSAFNAQPWFYLLASREDTPEFERMLGCLVEANQAWAQDASWLLLTVVRTRFEHNGKDNSSAEHDAGLAAANLSLEATYRGLHVHQMAGIDADKIRAVYELPEDTRAITATAIGYAADPNNLPEKLRERDQQKRSRRPLNQFVFSGVWNNSADWLTEE